MCEINRKHILNCALAPDTELLSPWTFLGDGNVFCSNEVTLVGSWMRTGHQEVQAMIRSLGISAPPAILLRRQKG